MSVQRGARRRRHVVVSAGPTREHLDPVRFLSNESSGRMGFAIAAAAARAGHRVTLVAGPVSLASPAGVERVDVVSAREMLAALREAFAGADALFMAAAVADWRPRRKLSGKWRAKQGAGRASTLSLPLVPNPDLLTALARQKGRRLVVGFALETGGGLERARAKLRQKKVDFVVWNDASALNATRARVTIVDAHGGARRVEGTKGAIARVLVSLVDAHS